MAQIGRAVPTPAASTVSGGRVAAGSRNVANVAGAPIEALSPKLGAFLDDGASLFNDFTQGGGSQPDKGKTEENAIGRFRSTSQAFAAFLELEGASEQGGDAAQGKGGGSLAGIIAHAINTYETNARVIDGTDVPLGNTLTVTL